MVHQPKSGLSRHFFLGFQITHSQAGRHTRQDSEPETSASHKPPPTQHTKNRRDKRLCPQQGSNPQSQQQRGRRPTSLTSRSPRLASCVVSSHNLKTGLTLVTTGRSSLIVFVTRLMIAFGSFHANIARLIYLMRTTVLLSLWYFSFIIYKTWLLTSLKWARLLREPITAVLRLETCQSLQRNSSPSAERRGPCYISFFLFARSNAPPS